MSKKIKQAAQCTMSLTYEFTGIRLQDTTLMPATWQITADLYATSIHGKTAQEALQSAGRVYHRMYFWLDSNLRDILLVDATNEDDLLLANMTSNSMMYFPGPTTDDLFIQLLHSKLTALAFPEIEVGQITIKGNDTSLKYTYSCDNGDYDLEDCVADYYTGTPSLHQLPWWRRNDGFCIEFAPPVPGEEISPLVDPLEEFDRVMEDFPPGGMPTKEPAKIVQVAKWQPKTV